MLSHIFRWSGAKIQEVVFDDLIYFIGPDGKFTLEDDIENHLF